MKLIENLKLRMWLTLSFQWTVLRPIMNSYLFKNLWETIVLLS